MSLFFGFYVAALPIFLLGKIKYRFKHMNEEMSLHSKQEYKEKMALHDKEFNKKWEMFYQDIKKTKMAMIYNYVFVLRKMIFVLGVYFLDIPSL